MSFEVSAEFGLEILFKFISYLTAIKNQFTSTFSVEEVSFHHAAHTGFRLKVLPADPSNHHVLPGLMDEIIIVKSKPKLDRDLRPKGGRIMPYTSISEKTKIQNTTSQASISQSKYESMYTSKRNRKSISSLKFDGSSMETEEEKDFIHIPIEKINNFFTCEGNCCLFCNSDLKNVSGINPIDHMKNCVFHTTFFSTFKLIPALRSLPPNIKEEEFSDDDWMIGASNTYNDEISAESCNILSSCDNVFVGESCDDRNEIFFNDNVHEEDMLKSVPKIEHY